MHVTLPDRIDPWCKLVPYNASLLPSSVYCISLNKFQLTFFFSRLYLKKPHTTKKTTHNNKKPCAPHELPLWWETHLAMMLL